MIFVKPLDRARVVKPEAYGLYLKGRYAFHQYTSQGWQEAIEHFNRAIEIDPEFAPAYSGLSETYLVAGAYGAVPTEEALTRGKAAAPCPGPGTPRSRSACLPPGVASSRYVPSRTTFSDSSLSSSLNRMPCTPEVARPMGRSA